VRVLPSAAAALATSALLAGCGAGPARTGGSALADLTVRVDPDGSGGTAEPRVLRLRCERAAQSRACGTVAAVSAADLAPTKPKTACAQIYGGPQTARVSGTLRGARVDARLSRTDSCESARWNRVRALLARAR
jgi:hypothetical protein